MARFLQRCMLISRGELNQFFATWSMICMIANLDFAMPRESELSFFGTMENIFLSIYCMFFAKCITNSLKIISYSENIHKNRKNYKKAIDYPLARCIIAYKKTKQLEINKGVYLKR